MELEGLAPVMETVRNGAPGLTPPQVRTLMIRFLGSSNAASVRDFYADLDAHLADIPFVAGEQFFAEPWSLSILQQRQSASQ